LKLESDTKLLGFSWGLIMIFGQWKHIWIVKCVHYKTFFFFLSQTWSCLFRLSYYLLIWLSLSLSNMFTILKYLIIIIVFKVNQSLLLKEGIQYFHIECLRVHNRKNSIKNVKVYQIKIKHVSLNILVMKIIKNN